jgi:adenylyltransferase/sulfurtransferase
MSLSSAELSRDSRHLSLKEFGMAGQEKLHAARVLVVGAGGLGSPALLYLAAAGVGTIGIVDHDRVDVSNLQRQVLFATSSVGELKAEAAATRLRALNPHLSVTAHALRLDADTVLDLLRDYDVVLDGTDHFGTRYVINDACVIERKPLVSAAIHRFDGQAFTYVPQQGGCYRCLFPDQPTAGAVPNCAEAGVLGVLPGVMGTIQATEAIKLLTGIGEPLVNRLLTYDALEMRFSEFNFARRLDCAVCGAHPSITSPQASEVACATAPASQVPQISALELNQLLHLSDRPALIDVREPHEFAAGHLPGAHNMPLSSFTEHLSQLPTGEMVFMCRGGGRSLQASQMASKTAAQRVRNLDGGLLAWQRDVEAELVVL